MTDDYRERWAAALIVDVPDGYELAGWVDEHGQMWGKYLRTGVVVTDRPLFARLDAADVDPDAQVRSAS